MTHAEIEQIALAAILRHVTAAKASDIGLLGDEIVIQGREIAAQAIAEALAPEGERE